MIRPWQRRRRHRHPRLGQHRPRRGSNRPGPSTAPARTVAADRIPRYARRMTDETPAAPIPRRWAPSGTLHDRGQAERVRAITDEGHTLEGDDGRAPELLAAAAAYAEAAEYVDAWEVPEPEAANIPTPPDWPWSPDTWKPGTAARMREKAYSLAQAALDAMNRADR